MHVIFYSPIYVATYLGFTPVCLVKYIWVPAHREFKIPGRRSEPQSPGFLEQRDECAVDVASHDRLDPAQELPADEHRRDGLLLAGAGELEEEGVDFAPVGVAVELHDGGADPEAEEELLDDVAHAAAAEREDDHRVAGREEPDSLVGRLQHPHPLPAVSAAGVHSD
ncbi:unnamed protein product [Cuscuta epithymum]|uniref:Uncharacterized protein n=1 Tax=Cuscuta epithymum TaxID=186058 RepID=A0AAV0CGB7_9ASTE|nr:unnamed protein product [Cuscuta epithymum]